MPKVLRIVVERGSGRNDDDTKKESNVQSIDFTSIDISYELARSTPIDSVDVIKSGNIQANVINCGICNAHKAFLNPISGNHICLQCERVF